MTSDPMNVPRYEFLARQAMEGQPLDAYGDNTTLDAFLDNKSETWPKDRERIHNAVLTALKDKYSQIPSGKRAVFIGGEPGAGKSTFRDSVTGLKDEDAYAISDPDVAREMLIEELVARGMMPATDARIEGGAKPLELSGLFHREAQAINEDFEQWAVSHGKNIIFDTSLAGGDKVNRDLDALHAKGYGVTGVLIDCDPDVALQRRMSRFEAESANPDGLGGRPVPPDFTSTVRSDAPKVFEQAQMRENGFDQSIRVDVTGAEPVLVGAWTGAEAAPDITGFHQMHFSPQSDAVFVPEGVEGYVAPDPKPQFRDLKPNIAEVGTDVREGVEEPNTVEPMSFEKDQKTYEPGTEPDSRNYDVHVDYGTSVEISDRHREPVRPDDGTQVENGLDGRTETPPFDKDQKSYVPGTEPGSEGYATKIDHGIDAADRSAEQIPDVLASQDLQVPDDQTERNEPTPVELLPLYSLPQTSEVVSKDLGSDHTERLPLYQLPQPVYQLPQPVIDKKAEVPLPVTLPLYELSPSVPTDGDKAVDRDASEPLPLYNLQDLSGINQPPVGAAEEPQVEQEFTPGPDVGSNVPDSSFDTDVGIDQSVDATFDSSTEVSIDASMGADAGADAAMSNDASIGGDTTATVSSDGGITTGI